MNSILRTDQYWVGCYCSSVSANDGHTSCFHLQKSIHSAVLQSTSQSCSLPALAKGLAEPIIILLWLELNIRGRLSSQIFQGGRKKNTCKRVGINPVCNFSIVQQVWLQTAFVSSIINITLALSTHLAIVLHFDGATAHDEQASRQEAVFFYNVAYSPPSASTHSMLDNPAALAVSV